MESLPKQSTFVNECLCLGYKHVLVVNMFYYYYFFSSSDLWVNWFVINDKIELCCVECIFQFLVIRSFHQIAKESMKFYWNKVDVVRNDSKWYLRSVVFIVSHFQIVIIIVIIIIVGLYIKPQCSHEFWLLSHHIISWMRNVECWMLMEDEPTPTFVSIHYSP